MAKAKSKSAAAPVKKPSASKPATKRAPSKQATKQAAPAKKAPAKKTAPAKKAPAKKARAAKAAPAKKAPAKKTAPAKKPPAAKTSPATKADAAKQAASAKDMKKYGKRADLGAAIDGFFVKQPPALRPITEELRKLIEEAAPDAQSSIKWGMPFYTLGEAMLCAIGAHKGHVNLILSGPAETFDDPHGRLTGEGKTGRHLKLTSLADLPREEVRGWLKSAVTRARAA